MKTLVLGGYGNFGARICRALANDPAVQLLVGGRDRARASSFAQALGHGAQGLAIDLTAPGFAQQLQQHGIELVIHTAGPFQQQDYAVARAAAAAGAHYIDLADGRRFVCDFAAALQAPFAAAGRMAVSGASTVPALSSAVVAHLSHGWQRVDAIDICIAPAQTAPRGKATLAAVLAYCGEAIPVWEGGRWQTRHGWARPVLQRFARLHPRLGALCDIPDLELFPAHFQVQQRVVFRAALEVGLTQRVFALLADLRRRGWIGSPVALAGLLQRTAPWCDFMGSALGGMVVRVAGRDALGRPVHRAWHIAADNDHGPEIPCMAAILLARRWARAPSPSAGLPAGAYACMGLLPLEDFAPEFARWGMVTEVLDEEPVHGA